MQKNQTKKQQQQNNNKTIKENNSLSVIFPGFFLGPSILNFP